MDVLIEMTDTFGNEANYCWVKRARATMPDFSSTRAVVRKAKKLLGLRGRHQTYDQGDRITIRPSGMNVVVFIDFTA